MRILITGASGFLATELMKQLGGHEIVRTDIAGQGVVHHDLTAGPGLLFDRPYDAIIHLAAVVSSEAEADLAKGLAVNIDATRTVLTAAAAQPEPPVVIFASSVAVFSAPGNGTIDEGTLPRPLSSYGAQKVIGEYLVRDFTRRGLIAGRSLRFPTIVVRPGRPNRAASSFASSIIREPVNGQEAVLPVSPDLRLHLASPSAAVAAMLHALDLPAERIGDETTITLPGLSVPVAGMLEVLEHRTGRATLVRHEPDEAIERIVSTWPGGIETPRAEELGFAADPDFEAIFDASLPLIAPA
ncbi:NAD-dependent epimerase/dehydratase family protein [Pontivivens ytuae]|uniref:NAD-dependent epimerase/dehydratase family protein n=1 Tax=Pontivivens ytuae TaxID=2789856 RepID=A0A7S9LNV2_9RHOB|nr:NAD-dependent epimerase/dehydratase family protein [Pontivivens ytuae]QPH52255.1 NAD-dependent epimerase/dehydratase family protein [Pontivivens ytuae]